MSTIVQVKILLLSLFAVGVSFSCTVRKIDLQGFATIAPRLKTVKLSSNDIDTLNAKKFGGKLNSVKLFKAGPSYLMNGALVRPKITSFKFENNYIEESKMRYSQDISIFTDLKVYTKIISGRKVLIRDSPNYGIRNLTLEYLNDDRDLLFTALIKIPDSDSTNVDKIINELVSTLKIKKQYISGQ